MQNIFLPDTEHGFYIFIKEVDKGSFGTVFFATDFRTRTPVAIKILNESDSCMSNKELNIHSMIEHDNIVKMYCCVMYYGKWCGLVMERVYGHDLYDIIQSKKFLDEEEAFAVFIQVYSAVRYLHSNLIVHRDIKPENILIGENGEVKLCDFGFATFYDMKEKLSKSCGSLSYAPPEIFRGEEYYGPEIDVWCMGIVLYMMVQGEAPVRKPGSADICIKSTFDDIERKFEWSSDLESMIRCLLINNKDARYKLNDIRNHSWVTKRLDKVSSKIDVTPIVTEYLLNQEYGLKYESFNDRLPPRHLSFNDDPNDKAVEDLPKSYTNIEKMMKRVVIKSFKKYEDIRENKRVIIVDESFRSSRIIEQMISRGYTQAVRNVTKPDCPEYHIYNMIMFKIYSMTTASSIFFLNGFIRSYNKDDHNSVRIYPDDQIEGRRIMHGIEKTPFFYCFCFPYYKYVFKLHIYCPKRGFTRTMREIFSEMWTSRNPVRFRDEPKGIRVLDVTLEYKMDNLNNVNECHVILEEGRRSEFKKFVYRIMKSSYDDQLKRYEQREKPKPRESFELWI